MADYCKLLYFFCAIILCKRHIAAESTITPVSASESITPTAAPSAPSTNTATTSETTAVSPSASVATTSSTSETTTVSPSASVATTSSTSETTTVSPSASVATTTSTSETTTVSPSASVATSSSTSETTTVSPSASVATTSTSETTTVSPSASVAITSSTSETTTVSPSASVATTSSTSETTTISPSASVATASSTSETTTVSPSASVATTSSTSGTSTVSPSASVATTSSTSETTTVSPSASVETTSSTSETTTVSPSASVTTTSSTSETTTVSPSASVATTSSTSETTTVSPSASVAQRSTFGSTTKSSSTLGTTKATTELTTTSKKNFTVDLGGRNLGLNFSIKVNINFTEDYKDKKSPQFIGLAKNFTNELTRVYQNISGFKYIEINEFRKGSTIANYSVIVSALINVTEVIDDIDNTVLSQLKNVMINGVQVDETYLDDTMNTELGALVNVSICKLSTSGLCPLGFKCSDLSPGRVSCSDRCNDLPCVHGTCYIDHIDGSSLKCRCPIDDDGYVYSGDRCEHKSLSTLIIITSAVGGGVLVAAFFIICLICMKMGRNTEQLDNIPLDDLPNYSQYFAPDSTYQPQYGYDLPLGRRKSIESRDLAGTLKYIPARDDGQENMVFYYEDQFGDYGGDPIRERQTNDYIGIDTKFEIRRPKLL